MINGKYPGGAVGQRIMLEQEGHKITMRGKRYVVAGYEKFLVKLGA